MAKGLKTGGKNWKTGQSGNPKGRPIIAPELSEARKFSKFLVEETFHRLLLLSWIELEKIVSNPNTCVLDRLLAKLIVMTEKEGCSTRLNFILDRLIGRIPNISSSNNSSVINREISTISEEAVVYQVVMTDAGKFQYPRPRLISKNK